MLRHFYGRSKSDRIGATEAALLRSLLSKSTQNHSRLSRLAAMGQGVDRHLFSLYNIAKERQGTDSTFQMPQIFLDKAWVRLNSTALSTSNVNAECLFSIGFGAVFPTGYGVAYCVRPNRIVASISCFKTPPSQEGGGFGGVSADIQDQSRGHTVATDAALYSRVLAETLSDIVSLWQVGGEGP